MSTRVKHIIKKLWSLPPKDREVWLEAIMGEFDEDFSHAKWREGYEQGKFEGAWVGNQLKDADKIRQELNKPVVPKFVADYIEFKKEQNFHVYGAMRVIEGHYDKRVPDWFYEGNIETFARAWLDGYEVEEEKRYRVKMRGVNKLFCFLSFHPGTNGWVFDSYRNTEYVRTHHTRKEIEAAGFGWVFDCEGIEIEEVEE